MASNENDGDAQMMSDDFEEEGENNNKVVSKTPNNMNDGSENEENKEDEDKINLDQSFDLSSDEDDDDENEDQNEDADDNKDIDLTGLELEKEDDDLFGDDQAKNNLEKADLLEAKEKSKSSTDPSLYSQTGANTSKTAASSEASASASRAEANKKKNQGTDNSNKELARKRKIEQMEEENKKMQVLMANFSEEQLNRYEIYRRSAFQKSTVKKIIQTVCGKTVSASVVIAMSGIAKVYVGEIVEKALDVKSKWNETGPIQPKHLREAFRLFKNSNKLTPSVKAKKPTLF